MRKNQIQEVREVKSDTLPLSQLAHIRGCAGLVGVDYIIWGAYTMK